MVKVLKNISMTDEIHLNDIGRILSPNQHIKINPLETEEFLNSDDTLQAIRDGRLQVGDGWTFYTDPLEGEVYFRTRYGDDAYYAEGDTLRVYTPVIVTDVETGGKAVAPFMNLMTIMRELYNDPNLPSYVPNFQPLIGPDGREVEHLERTLNLESIHSDTGWHMEEIRQGNFQRPQDILFYYGWPNSFNSGDNGWNNENVAQDMAKYGLVILGDGVQDPGHGDYANTQIIIPRIKNLNPLTKIFGYVTANQDRSAFETKATQWNDLGVDGIFIDEAGYDFGVDRLEFNRLVDYVHLLSSANIAFVNAWNMDHIIGTENDDSYPNSTYNPNEMESSLIFSDWYLLESFTVNTNSYASGYEAKSDWAARGMKAINHRDTYGINLASVSQINNDNAEGQDYFNFAFTSAMMFSLNATGSSDHFYGASSAAVVYWTRPDVTGMGKVYADSPSVQLDQNDSDVYHRYVEFGKFTIDFSDGAKASSITKF